ncbi:MAG: hypothetical protein ACRC0J_15215 [Shewanella oncorhynchi]
MVGLGDILSGVGSVLGFFGKKDSANQAAQLQSDAINRQLNMQQKAYDTTRKDMQPYLGAGTAGLGEALSALGLGVGGNAQQQAYLDKIKNGALYRTLAQAQDDAILQNASATGGLRGGNTQRSLSTERANLLQGIDERQQQKYMNLAQMGQNTALGSASQNSSNASAMNQLIGNQAGAGVDRINSNSNNLSDLIASLSRIGKSYAEGK